MTKEKPICKECGSDNVLNNANVRWDVDEQDWVVADTFEDEWCSDCQTEVEFEWVEVS